MLLLKTLTRCSTALLLTAAATSFAGDSGKASPKAPVAPAPAPSPFIYDFELKTRFEVRENNFDFNSSNNALTDDSWLLYHARLGLGWQPTPWFKIYAQGQDAREFDSDRPKIPGVLGAEGDDTFDLRQFYIQLGEEKKGPSLKVGRQLLTYGDERLIGPLEWNNFSRSWDAAKLRYAGEKWWVDGFAASLVTINDDKFNKSDLFNNEGLGRNQVLSGIYFSTTALDFQTTDLYAFYLHEEFPVGDSDFVTLGTRWKSTPGKFGPWDYTVELVAQTGDVKGKDLAAFAGHAELGYTFDAPWKPRLALDYSYGSGDSNAADGKVNTFQNLYPTNHLYYGYMDAFSWQNIHDINASLKVAPSKSVTARLDYHAFFLADTGDAWYRANGVATVRPISPGADSYAGSEVDLTVTYAATKHLSFMAGYSHFFAGSYLSDTGASDDADFGYIQATLKF
ncbi:MAG: alginate export family protein [Verrucomicrobiaceae bacterium]|nr:alginate export family protein [Verrucomicrobiaceae bacterium]